MFVKFLKRPVLSNFIAINADEKISIRLNMSMLKKPYAENLTTKEIIKPTSPLENLEFFEKNDYRIKIVGMTAQSEIVLFREYNTDEYAMISVRIPNAVGDKHITSLQVYETKYHPGLELLMGSFIPLKLKEPKKIIISDFDKTLVDTRYSTAKELMHSLRNPIDYFPTVEKSLELVKDFIKDGHGAFILSASPHFYEKAFRDWLYQNEIYTSNIFLKDYRKIFSFFESDLTTKDLKSQGFYKLNELVQIILMTGIPNNLVLVGDGFEADSMIYLIIRSVLIERMDPWTIWKQVRRLAPFKLTRKQQGKLLTNLHLLASQKVPREFELKIFIRCKENNIQEISERRYEVGFLDRQKPHISFYSA